MENSLCYDSDSNRFHNTIMPFDCLLDAVHVLVNEARGLSEGEAYDAMRLILAGGQTPVQIAAFLTALRVRGETVEEVTGCARAMREAAIAVRVEPDGGPLIDTCGTGGTAGSSIETFNISTLAAFVTAGAGVRVAKHGNRSITSRCSSAAVLQELGVHVAVTGEEAAESLRRTGICFLFAPAFHQATRHVQPVRTELKMRTIFHMLGPLTNPAGATAQLAGAFSYRAAELMAGALARLGLRRGFVVHGSDGLDEVTTTGPTAVFAVQDGAVTERSLGPADFGVDTARAEDLGGGDPAENAAIARAILAGERGPKRDIVLVNAALALMAAEKAANPRAAMRVAAESIDSGAARAKLDELAGSRV
jgi:anthranilate phosphoribosyltransferase